ncbi:putative HMP/thiamine import ATP-binding protein YkoD [Pullulanibacillus camelliae]|uniref:Putative HMP/thiamine import ATP-binding protein YkoD n=1 Tax=Pullulanibacillus camelliae TaxID=1707096 RepID=A0A8J3DVA1_9BACL|nr:ABC transporter ATP-binding protein [Pullulanibacillus camelliae]GGE44615.1 putative HMP/thiamine import ATP-binding protein YkoD [Pullulanibacillus camelliae]
MDRISVTQKNIPPHLGCKNLSVWFPEQVDATLQNVTLSIAKGEKVLFLGPSGCGKSTLLSVLSGLIPKHIDADVKGTVYGAEQCGVMFQDPDTQFCMLRVDEEIAFSLENRAIPRQRMDDLIHEVKETVGLDIPGHTMIQSLSGGMKQRLALACLLALEPDALFFDEPTAQLDPAGQQEVFQCLHDYSVKSDKTFIFIEHRLDGLIEWMDKVFLFDASGSLVAAGNPKDILTTYESAIDKAGIWKPQLFPATWNDVVAQEHHPISLRLTQAVHHCAHNAPSTPGPTPLFEVTDLELGYGDSPIMREISFTIEQGEWVTIIGKNGSGKSTLLKALARLTKGKAEHLTFMGKELNRWSEKQLYERLGFVFQNPEWQFVTQTVYDEIAFAGKLRDWPAAKLKKTTERLLKTFHLEQVANQHPFTLSQGQKRRLSVATMLLLDQQALLLDEPTFGQDARTTAELMKKLKERKQRGTAIIMVTHDMNSVSYYAERVLLLAGGHLQFNGRPHDLFSNTHLCAQYDIIPPLGYPLIQARKTRADNQEEQGGNRAHDSHEFSFSTH